MRIALFRTFIFSLTATFCFCVPNAPVFSLPGHEFSGRVTDPNGVPIIGASVILSAEGKTLRGTATDFEGSFRFSVASDQHSPVEIRVTSVGYREERRVLDPVGLTSAIVIVCTPSPVELAGIRVTPPPTPKTFEFKVPQTEVSIAASKSLIASNPIAALRFPQMAKVGSNHSSQVRIDGTSPQYCLNGIPISADPEHYGMLAILPASVVSEIRFYPQGGNASYALPTTIDLVTPTQFAKHSQGDISISTIDANGSYSIGNKRFFALGAIRQSILNNVLDVLGQSQQQQSAPPIDFRDLFFSAGWQMSGRWRAIVDEYSVRDRLSFDTLSVIGSKLGMGMAQKTKEDYAGLRLRGSYSRWSITGTAAVRDGYKEYRAYPASSADYSGIRVLLNENYRSLIGGLDASILLRSLQIKIGGQLDWALRRAVDLDQINWSFQPPFANTSNPYIYQDDLNRLYGSYHENRTGHTSATYLSATVHAGPFEVENGIRISHYSDLVRPDALTSRHSVRWSLGTRSSAELFYGTFAESPVTNILEPQQPLIRANLSRLTWIKTSLLAGTIAYGPFRLTAFDKRITDQPFLTPDIGHSRIAVRHGNATYYYDNPNYLTMQSTAKSHFTGYSVALDADHLYQSRVAIYLSYAYTHAEVTSYGVTVPYDLSAPHRFVAQFNFQITPRFSAGTELQAHSGYPYSPARSIYDTQWDIKAYYVSQLAAENSLRFTTNFILNLFASYKISRGEIFVALANTTNRANELVSVGDGFVTDPGILPSVGFRLTF